MRAHAVILGVALAGFAGWLAFWPREQHPDLVRARDSLVASDALVVRFDPGGVGGYRFISLKDEGWLWERTDARGNAYPDALIFNGQDHLLRISEACYVTMRDVRPPLIPGLTITPRLARQPDLDRQEGERYVYAVSPAFAARADYPSTIPDLEVTEDLSSLRASGVVKASTGIKAGYIWRGNYEISEATPGEVARARDVLSNAYPSDYAELIVRERVVGNVVGSVLLEASSLVVAKDCPDSPARLWAGSRGGQSEGLRTTPAQFQLTHGDTPVFRNAFATSVSVRAPVDYLNDVFETASYGDVPVTTTRTIIINLAPNYGVALLVQSCTSRPWFHC